MRLPIDDTTEGFVYKYSFDHYTDIVVFKKCNIRQEITFGEFKSKYNVKSTSAFEDNVNGKKLSDSIKELAKNFKFNYKLLED